MKIITLIILVLSQVCYCQNQDLVTRTKAKLKNDKRSYEQFVFLGFCNCLDKKLYSNSFQENYITLFNHLEPFPRLFDQDNIKKNIDIFQLKFAETYFRKDVKLNGYEIARKCIRIYKTSNKELKKSYQFLIEDEKLQKLWIDDYMEDYSEGYFIKIETE